jgi:kynureninase
MDLFEKWRDEFPILSRTVYMISNSLGAMPRRTAQNLADYANTWATRGVRAWEERWWEMPLEVGNKIADVIGAPAGTVSMHENVTTAHMVALSCVRPAGRRRRLVCTEMDFPSMIYLYRAQQTAGFDVHVVPAEPDLTVRTERLLEAIDESTAVVAFSHVLFRTSYIMDAASIVARAHDVGAVAILDTYQSAGIIPVDVTALHVDFATGGCLKWLCGGPGNAFLYTRPDLLKSVQPSFTGWVSHRAPFSFDTDAVAEHARTDAMRMMNGTPSIPAYYAALAGLDIIREVGVDRIREKSCRLTGRLLNLVDEYGFQSAASRDPNRLAGTVAVSVPDAHLVSRTLKARDFVVDYRPPVGVRISPHFYNTMDEIDRIMAEIASIVDKRDYDAGEAKSLVT